MTLEEVLTAVVDLATDAAFLPFLGASLVTGLAARFFRAIARSGR